MQFLETNSINLAYEDHGQGEKTLILLHGLTANMFSFNGLLNAGLAESYRVIRVDLRGRGHSDYPETGYHMRDHAKDIIGLMDALNIDSAILVGHSFGGLLSTVMAGIYADRLEKIIIIDAGREVTTEKTIEQIRPSLERLKMPVPDIEAAIDVMRNAPYFTDGRWLPEIEDWYRSELAEDGNGGYKRLIYADGIMQAIDHNLADDWEVYFRGVQVPALLIHVPEPLAGEGSSPILSIEGAEETVALIPDCQYCRVSGHHITMVFGDNALQVVDAIRNFAG